MYQKKNKIWVPANTTSHQYYSEAHSQVRKINYKKETNKIFTTCSQEDCTHRKSTEFINILLRLIKCS